MVGRIQVRSAFSAIGAVRISRVSISLSVGRLGDVVEMLLPVSEV